MLVDHVEKRVFVRRHQQRNATADRNANPLNPVNAYKRGTNFANNVREKGFIVALWEETGIPEAGKNIGEGAARISQGDYFGGGVQLGLGLAQSYAIIEGGVDTSRVVMGKGVVVGGNVAVNSAESQTAKSSRNLHTEAEAARDALAADLKATSKHPPATVVGAYSPSSGNVTAQASRGGGLGCAEGACAEVLGAPSDISVYDGDPTTNWPGHPSVHHL